MPTRGLKEAKAATSKLVGRISGPMSEATVTAVLIIGAGYASVLTPVATSLLINSQLRSMRTDSEGVHGRLAYTAEYAAAVNAAKGTLKGTNTPRSPATLGVYWAPDGEPDFLRKGFERDGAEDIKAAIERGMKL
jgi:hypothetical protein